MDSSPARRWQPVLLRAALLGLLSAVAIGCGVAPDQPTLDLVPTPESVPAAVRDAMDLRSTSGLRADEAYVRALEADPDAVQRGIDHGVAYAISEAEAGIIDARALGQKGVAEAATTYGTQFPDEWGGLYLDRPTGAVIVLFTGHLVEHETALRRLLHPAARFEVRRAGVTLAELEAVADAISADHEWMSDERIIFTGVGADAETGKVLVDVTSDRPEASTIVTDHYDDDRISVRVDDRMPWTGGWSQVTFAVTGPGSSPGTDLTCRVASTTPSVYPQESATDDDGRCYFQLATTAYQYAITRTIDGAEVVLAQGSFRVPKRGDLTVPVQVAP